MIVVILDDGKGIRAYSTVRRMCEEEFGVEKYSYVRQKLSGRLGEWVLYKGVRIARVKVKKGRLVAAPEHKSRLLY